MVSVRLPSYFNPAKNGMFPGQKAGSKAASYGVPNSADNPTGNPGRTNNNSEIRSDMRRLLDGLNKNSPTDYKIINGKKVFSQTLTGKENGFLKLAGASIEKDLEAIKNRPKYKYKEVSSKIRAAKNSVSAGQALLAAKRTVSDIKRQLGSGKGDKDELILALSHAKRIEMAARKKKKHLETEELIENARSLTDKLEEAEGSGFSEQEIRSSIVEGAEDDLMEMEDEILNEREELNEELSESLEEVGELSEEMMGELSSMIAEFGEEELRQLEENMEMLENIEVIDPHMSEEDFKKLKIKHRGSEEKVMVKADMEYLKGLMELTVPKEGLSGFDIVV